MGEVAEIMGDRYDNVLEALEGKRPFVVEDEGVDSLCATQAAILVESPRQPLSRTPGSSALHA